MKFIGQYIQDFIARFRSDVYLESVSSGTIASGGNLGLDSNNKIVKAAEVGTLTTLVVSSADTTVKFVGLPTSDPETVGQLWSDEGTLKVSAGA